MKIKHGYYDTVIFDDLSDYVSYLKSGSNPRVFFHRLHKKYWELLAYDLGSESYFFNPSYSYIPCFTSTNLAKYGFINADELYILSYSPKCMLPCICSKPPEGDFDKYPNALPEPYSVAIISTNSNREKCKNCPITGYFDSYYDILLLIFLSLLKLI